jgi:beta-galactosidase
MHPLSRRDFIKNSLAASTFAATSVTDIPSLTPEKTGIDMSRPASAGDRERLLFDFGWRFHLGHANDPTRDFGFRTIDDFTTTGSMVAPSRDGFDDKDWRPVDLPHDWVVELGIEESKVRANLFHGFRPVGWAYPDTSIGWYRRVFSIPETDRGKRIWIEFDGVYRDSIVGLNGHFLGRHMSGYSGFRYDISDFANYGGKNVLVVRADATCAEGWWYEGGGIYRHVWLVKTNVVHLAPQGVFVTSDARPAGASVSITSDVENHGDVDMTCRLRSTIVDGAGKEVAVMVTTPISIPAWGNHKFKQQTLIQQPKLWSVDSPYLYRVVSMIEARGVPIDRCETKFGIRSIRFDKNDGFFLNGRPLKIKGTCNHQDHAGVGTALPDRIQHFRIEKLKEMGCNAYRTTHNPATPELLDACDALGMLVLCEPRMTSSNPEGLRHLEAMVMRDRNHPCVLGWSLGNQEPGEGTDRGRRIVSTMKLAVKRLDPTRPVTYGMSRLWGQGVSQVLDVQGFNYGRVEAIDEFRKKFPDKPMLGTEVASSTSTRGIYVTDEKKGHLSAYDTYEKNRPGWGCPPDTWWKIYSDRPFLAGGFVWAGFDYRGEPTSPNHWPNVSSQYGNLDTCGFPKDSFFYYQAWWTDKPLLHIFPHWDWKGREGQEIEVYCYSNLDSVELFLNGISFGKKEMPRNSHLVWKVQYAPGVLEAKGYKGGRETLSVKRETTNEPARIVLRPGRQRISADGEDVSLIEVRIEDNQGRLVPTADNEVSFEFYGPGKIIGTGNGNPSSHEPDKASKRRAFNGLCMVIVQSLKQAGELRLVAESAGLANASVVILCEKVTLRPAVD